jgi:hypothetical protein
MDAGGCVIGSLTISVRFVVLNAVPTPASPFSAAVLTPA